MFFAHGLSGPVYKKALIPTRKDAKFSELRQEYPFFEYSASNWARHFARIQSSADWFIRNSDCQKGHLIALHWACRDNNNPTVIRSLRTGVKLVLEYQRPLNVAGEFGNLHIGRILLSNARSEYQVFTDGCINSVRVIHLLIVIGDALLFSFRIFVHLCLIRGQRRPSITCSKV